MNNIVFKVNIILIICLCFACKKSSTKDHEFCQQKTVLGEKIVAVDLKEHNALIFNYNSLTFIIHFKQIPNQFSLICLGRFCNNFSSIPQYSVLSNDVNRVIFSIERQLITFGRTEIFIKIFAYDFNLCDLKTLANFDRIPIGDYNNYNSDILDYQLDLDVSNNSLILTLFEVNGNALQKFTASY